MHVSSWHSSTSRCLYPPYDRARSPNASHSSAWHSHFYHGDVLFSHTSTLQQDCQHNNVCTQNVCTPVHILPSDGTIYKYMPHAFNVYTPFPALPHFGKKNSFNDLWSDPYIIYISNKNSPDLIVLLFHHNTYRGMNFSIPCWEKSMSCVISHVTIVSIISKFVAAKTLLQHYKQTITAQCQIRAVCGMLQCSLVTRLYTMYTYFLTDSHTLSLQSLHIVIDILQAFLVT